MCPALGLNYYQARDDLPMHVGLQIIHRMRLADGDDLTWPEVEEQEMDALRTEARRTFGLA